MTHSTVKTDLILACDLTNQLEASWKASERLARNMPDDRVDIYRAGVLSGLLAVAEAHGLNCPTLRNAETELQQKRRKPSRHDMRL